MRKVQKNKNLNNASRSREEELQKVFLQAKALEEHANILSNQITMLNGTIQDIQRTIETLDGLISIGDNYKNKEILLPISKNVFVTVTLKSKNVLFGITDNIFIERNLEEAKNYLNEDIKKINAVIENLKKKHSEIINKISTLSEYGEQLAQQE